MCFESNMFIYTVKYCARKSQVLGKNNTLHHKYPVALSAAVLSPPTPYLQHAAEITNEPDAAFHDYYGGHYLHECGTYKHRVAGSQSKNANFGH